MHGVAMAERMKPVRLVFTEEEHKALRIAAAVHGKSMSAYCLELVLAALARQAEGDDDPRPEPKPKRK